MNNVRQRHLLVQLVPVSVLVLVQILQQLPVSCWLRWTRRVPGKSSSRWKVTPVELVGVGLDVWENVLGILNPYFFIDWIELILQLVAELTAAAAAELRPVDSRLLLSAGARSSSAPAVLRPPPRSVPVRMCLRFRLHRLLRWCSRTSRWPAAVEPALRPWIPTVRPPVRAPGQTRGWGGWGRMEEGRRRVAAACINEATHVHGRALDQNTFTGWHELLFIPSAN